MHMEYLRSKYIKGLHILFEAHAPTLATQFTELPISTLLSSPPVVKLGYHSRGLEQEFDKWQRERTQESRKAFDEMLSENSFVEFWGRLGKIGGEGVDGGVKADVIEGDDGEGGGGKVDMKVLAKNVDVADMEKVLKVGVYFLSVMTGKLNQIRTTNDTSCSIMSHNRENVG